MLTEAPEVPEAPTQTKALKIALIGSPNSGKTTLFNALTGLKQRVGNFTGVTVDFAVGKLNLPDGSAVELIDLPGINGLQAASTDEDVTIQVLLSQQSELHVDAVWLIGDLTHPRRSLLLASQIRDLGYPMALVFNRLDFTSPQQADVFCQAIEVEWNLPVVAVSAGKKERLSLLLELPNKARTIPMPESLFPNELWKEIEIAATKDKTSPYRWYRRALFSQADYTLPEGLKISSPQAWLDRELALRLDRIDNSHSKHIAALTASTQPERRRSRAIDKWLMHPYIGPLAILLCLLGVFQLLFTVSATPMDWIDGGMAAAGSYFKAALPDAWWSRLLVDGIWAGLQGVFVFLPQIALLFGLVAILEESGYMARLVSWLDRPMRRLGLGGKSMAPLIGGFACAVPSIMLARNLPDKRQRVLTILLVPFMSCSARFPVFLVLIAVLIPESTPFLGLDVRAWCMAAAVLVGPVVGLLFVQAIAPFFGRPAQASFLIAELPPYRRPGLWDVLKVMYERSKIFVLEAGKVILAVSIVLWFLASYGPTEKREQLAAQYQTELQAYSGTEEARADLIQQHEAQWLESSFAGQMGQAFEPLIRPLGYDWRIGVALLTSFAAREVFVGTMSTLFAAGNEDGSSGRLVDRLRAARNDNTGAPLFTVAAVVSLLLFYSLALQCMSTVAIMKRELGGWGLTLASLGWHTALAWLAAFAAWQLLS